MDHDTARFNMNVGGNFPFVFVAFPAGVWLAPSSKLQFSLSNKFVK